MRRAAIATAGTVLGLVALLDYKSAGSVKGQQVAIAPSTGAPAGTTSTTVPSSGGTTTTAGATTAPRTYTGQLVSYQYGDIQVVVTIQDGKILTVSVPQNTAPDMHSQMVNSEAVPVLEREAVSAQGLDFDAVSGATFTSDAFAQSLQSALQKAGK